MMVYISLSLFSILKKKKLLFLKVVNEIVYKLVLIGVSVCCIES
jgi:hypothetical protein